MAFNGECATQLSIFREWPIIEAARSHGFEIAPTGDLSVRLHVEINYSDRKSHKNLRGIPRSKLVLFALEPRAVIPRQHRLGLRKKFGLVLVSSPDQLILHNDVFVNYGFLPKDKQKLLAGPRGLGSLAVLNANKSSWVSGSQYKTRKSFARKLAGLGFEVTIAGEGWGRGFHAEFLNSVKSLVFCVSQGEFPDFSRFSLPINPKLQNLTVGGVIDDGFQFLRGFEFALVIENDLQYLSEKVFNALEAGCIPLYLGPKLSKFGIPESIVVDLSKETAASLERLKSDAAQKELILKAGKSFLASTGVRDYWSHEAGLSRFFACLRTYLS